MNQGLNETERYAMDELNRLRQWYETASKPYFDMLVRERQMRMPDRFIMLNPIKSWAEVDKTEAKCPKHPRYTTCPFCPDCRQAEEALRPDPVEQPVVPASKAWMEGYEAGLQWVREMDKWHFGGHGTPRPPVPRNPYKAGETPQ